MYKLPLESRVGAMRKSKRTKTKQKAKPSPNDRIGRSSEAEEAAEWALADKIAPSDEELERLAEQYPAPPEWRNE